MSLSSESIVLARAVLLVWRPVLLAQGCVAASSSCSRVSGGQFFLLKGVCAITATEGSLQNLRDRVATYHLEQLLARRQPEGRSNESWQRILETVQTSLVAKLDSLHSVNSIWQFAHRTLKCEDLKAAFREFAFDDVSEFAVPEQVQQDFLHSNSESPSFDRDLEVFDLSFPLSEQDLSRDLRCTAESSAASSSARVFAEILPGTADLGDLDQLCTSDPKRARFSSSLRPGETVDLESEDHSS